MVGPMMLMLSPPIRAALISTRAISTSSHLCKSQAGRFKISIRKDNPLTYEQANPPHQIAFSKTWNSFNTSNLLDGLRKSESATEEFFIRKFITGTWHRLILSDIIIKRRGNMITVGGIVVRNIHPRKMYFLLGYSEEMLSCILKCPVKMDLQTVNDKKDVIFKYV